MSYLQRTDHAEALVLAQDADDMLDMYEAAKQVEGMSIEVMPSASEAERVATAAACMELARAINKKERSTMHNPKGWAERARQKMEAGGYVIRLTAQAASGRSAQANLSQVHLVLDGIRQADEPLPSETKAGKDDSVRHL